MRTRRLSSRLCGLGVAVSATAVLTGGLWTAAVPAAYSDTAQCPWMDATQSPDQRAGDLVGAMTLEGTLTSRDSINPQLRTVLEEATEKWGVRVTRVELKSIDPPRTIQEAMEQGLFDNLPGRGKPLDLSDEDNPFVPRDMRLAYRMLRQHGYVLPWIDDRKDLERKRSEIERRVEAHPADVDRGLDEIRRLPAHLPGQWLPGAGDGCRRPGHGRLRREPGGAHRAGVTPSTWRRPAPQRDRCRRREERRRRRRGRRR